MNRPNRVTAPSRLAGYTVAPPFAWSGWRLRVPGGPVGGQYHGFIGPDSAGWPSGRDEIMRTDGDHSQLGDISTDPWASLWGGTVLLEGQDQSDHVFRSSAEMRPRPNASGGAHVVHGYQTRRSAGFALAPGNYRSLGVAVVRSAPRSMPAPRSMLAEQNVIGNPNPGGPMIPAGPCPAWGCGGPPAPVKVSQWGATSTVAQPPAPTSLAPVNVVASSYPPTSPQPAPTVAASTSLTQTPGQPLPPVAGAPWQAGQTYPLGMTVTDSNGNLQQVTIAGVSGAQQPLWNTQVGGTTSGDGGVTWQMTAAVGAGSPGASWFSQSTVIPGVENMWLAIGAGVALYLMMKKK